MKTFTKFLANNPRGINPYLEDFILNVNVSFRFFKNLTINEQTFKPFLLKNIKFLLSCIDAIVRLELHME